MIQDENFNDNKQEKQNKGKSLLGKKVQKKKYDDDELFEKKLTKNIDRLTMDEKDKENSSESEYETITDEEEVYESEDDNSDNYEEKKLEDFKKTSNKKDNNVQLWDDKKENIKKDEELIFDNQAYQMLHRSNVSWPCFSVDWILPEFFIPQPMKNFYNPIKPSIHLDEFPYTCYFIAGAQTSEKNGVLYYMKWFNMHRTLYDEDPDKEADSESEGGEPFMEHSIITTKGNVNRVKTMKNSFMAAYWSDLGSVELIDLRKNIEEMEGRWQDDSKNKKDNKNKKKKVEEKNPHVKSFKKKDEGFALEWNNFLPGVFASGGYDNEIEIHIPTDEIISDYTSSKSSTNIYDYVTSFKANKGGIEDIAWSPSNPNTLLSVGIDKTIRMWDLRVNCQSNSVFTLDKAHDKDINCTGWKASSGAEMIATGSDDCSVKIWDPRFMTNSNSTIANIQYHKEPITALCWDPLSPCQLSVTSEDNRLSIWDFSVEPDENKVKDLSSNKEIPDQLVFLHQGQENLKDVKFHPYYQDMLLSTAENGINMFKPNFDEDEIEEEDEDFTFNI